MYEAARLMFITLFILFSRQYSDAFSVDGGLLLRACAVSIKHFGRISLSDRRGKGHCKWRALSEWHSSCWMRNYTAACAPTKTNPFSPLCDCNCRCKRTAKNGLHCAAVCGQDESVTNQVDCCCCIGHFSPIHKTRKECECVKVLLASWKKVSLRPDVCCRKDGIDDSAAGVKCIIMIIQVRNVFVAAMIWKSIHTKPVLWKRERRGVVLT